MIYLDYAATTPLSRTTKEELISLLDEYGNPSSLHSFGQRTHRILSHARKTIADFIGGDAQNVYFTSGGAASNTLGIRGYAAKHDCRIFYSPIAHKSVLNCVDSIPHSTPLKVNSDGQIIIPYLKEVLKTARKKPFVVIDYANSEIGTIQNIKEIIGPVHSFYGTIYLDCTGSIPTIPIDVKKLDVDMLGFSAHKLGGLKGCGVFYKKPEITLEPLVYGSQEQGLFGGTENILGIASLYSALKQYDYTSISSSNRDYVYQNLIRHVPQVSLVGSFHNRLAHNLYLCFKGVDGEALTLLLDGDGIAVSTGSACNSHSLTASPVLSAIGMDENDIHSCIRLTFGGNETRKELDYVCRQIQKNVESLRGFLPQKNKTGGCFL